MKMANGVNLHWQRNKFKFPPSITRIYENISTTPSLAPVPFTLHPSYLESFYSKPERSPLLRHHSIYIEES